MQIDAISHVSPNCDDRPAGSVIDLLVIHSSEGSARSGLRWLTNPSSGVSSHYFITRTGATYQLVPDVKQAWHAGRSAFGGVPNVNARSIGIELAHIQGEDWPAAQIAALTDLCRAKMADYAISVDRVVSHRAVAIPANRKSDPTNWPETAFHVWAQGLANSANALDDTALPVPEPDDAYTVHSPLLAPITVPVEVVIGRWRYTRAGGYTPYDVTTILRAIWHHAALVGLDPVLAAAQMAHETGNLGSWWCMRPRRNPAGLRVTGETSLIPRLSREWAWNSNTKRWHRGLSFPTWADDAIPAHLGRLLAYALPVGHGTPEQQALITRALTLAPLPASYRGCAALLVGIEGTWAVPGDNYADRIAAIANQFSGRA